MEASGVRYGESARPKGVVEASLRASFATALFESTSDLKLVAWRLRVKNIEVLSHYVHELQSQTFMSHQPQSTRTRIPHLASIAPTVIPQAIRFLQAGVAPAIWPSLWRPGHFDH